MRPPFSRTLRLPVSPAASSFRMCRVTMDGLSASLSAISFTFISRSAMRLIILHLTSLASASYKGMYSGFPSAFIIMIIS